MEKISIRKVEESELDALREISIRTFTESFASENSEADMNDYISKSRSVAQISKEFHTPGSDFYFALSEEKPIGYLKLNSGAAQTEFPEQNSIEIQQIYVDKDFQNLKIGQMLLDTALKIASEKNFEFIWLGVWERNAKAILFYERNGFEIFDKHQFALGTDVQTDLLMKKQLK